MAQDYYDVLGVSRDAGPEEIQRAYRMLARRYHPDINSDPAAEERFKEINEAYHVLADPDTRRRYNRFGPDFRQVREEPAGAGAAGARAGGWTGGAGGRTGGADGWTGGAGGWTGGAEEGIDIEDLLGRFGTFRGRGFDDLFGGAASMSGADQEAEIVLTVEEAYRGGTRRISLAGREGERGYEVKIPPGVIDGQRIRLSGQGGLGRGDGAPGDLYLVVRIAPHDQFRLDGRDIYVDAPVAPWEAVLGAKVSVPTPGGEAKVRVPPGSSSGRQLRLTGEGMPNRRGKPGDLYATVRILVPKRLSARERELWNELSRESRFDPRKQR